MADPAKKRSNSAISRGGESQSRGAKGPRLATRDNPTEGRGGKPKSPPAGSNKTASGPLARQAQAPYPEKQEPVIRPTWGLPNRPSTIARTAERHSSLETD
ncbi:unnamed protein product [Acanthoscelides obtectus]|uniref:Uncharacterized protein n=1 Tax=Acanthoscelides obtectus TaxID=200917 RepID=A0A9P0PU69_ACAOB|nr:unnamed protein product [Acanthoscelides obtectus]CAK1681976.1 hypothetical protein AOBTE_LOCUS33360 [Acanthoscelides obtectus]